MTKYNIRGGGGDPNDLPILDQKISTVENASSNYKVLGLVTGIGIRNQNFFQDIMTNAGTLFTNKRGRGFQGNLAETLKDARNEALKNMYAEATEKHQANHVIGTRIEVSQLSMDRGSSTLIVTAYGTAVNDNSLPPAQNVNSPAKAEVSPVSEGVSPSVSPESSTGGNCGKMHSSRRKSRGQSKKTSRKK